MNLSQNERMAVFNFLKVMVWADGKLDAKERIIAMLEPIRMGVDPSELEEFEQEASKLEFSDALEAIAHMNAENKKFTAALLGAAMYVDGEVDEEELKLWRFVTEICSLPTMTVKEASEYMANL